VRLTPAERRFVERARRDGVRGDVLVPTTPERSPWGMHGRRWIRIPYSEADREWVCWRAGRDRAEGLR
jgi:hypothetical protein